AGFCGRLQTLCTYLKAIIAYQSDYALSGGPLTEATYFLVRIPTQLGQVEAWGVIAGVLVSAIALLRRRLGPSEMTYGTIAVRLYIVFSLTPSKNPLVGDWFSFSVWIFFVAVVTSLAPARCPEPMERAARATVPAV